jgi:hypothetical protein
VLPGTFVKAWGHFSNESFTAGFQTKIISLLKLVDGKWTTIATQDWYENQ